MIHANHYPSRCGAPHFGGRDGAGSRYSPSTTSWERGNGCTGKDMQSEPIEYKWEDADLEMRRAAEPYQDEYGIKFETLLHFPREVLDALHAPAQTAAEVEGTVTIASDRDTSILAHMRVLRRIAKVAGSNPSDLPDSGREEYRSALVEIYNRLPSHPDQLIRDGGTLCLGIEREGRFLAGQTGWLPKDVPGIHAKRIPFAGGLLVGLTKCQTATASERCVIVDGAIASGATVVAVLKKLSASLPAEQAYPVYLYSVHGSFEGLRAIMRYGTLAGMEVRITVGHATPGINDHFYAVDEAGDVLVGDLGDTLFGTAPIAH